MSSIFGTQLPNDASNRFTNLTVNLPQQQSTSQQQQNSLQPPGSQKNSLIATDEYTQNEEKSPSWFNNPRKRSIPQTIIKRSSKPASSDGPSPAPSVENNTDSSVSGFGTVTFGSKKATIFNSRANTQGTDGLTSGNLIDSNEAPPMKSLYDLRREDEFGSLLSVSQVESEQPMSLKKSSETGTMRNVFDREVIPKQEKKDDQAASVASQTHNESAVLVFGYPESISNQVIIHFSKFGNILEDFEVLRGASTMRGASLRVNNKSKTASMRKKYPIFTGDGWIKLTYDSPSCALRALQENGSVYCGSLIGCVPYTKHAVEQLASCRIEKADDIGEVNFSVAQTPSHTLASTASNNYSQQASQPHENEHARFTFSTRKLDIKDGNSLFLHDTNAHNHNFLKNLEHKMKQHEALNQSNGGGIINKFNTWLFGWNDL